MLMSTEKGFFYETILNIIHKNRLMIKIYFTIAL